MPAPRSSPWAVVSLLAAGAMIAYVDRSTLSVALALHDFNTLFHLTDADRGWLNSAFFISYALLQAPAGWIVDRWGVKVPYIAGFLLWGAVSAATALASSATQLFALRLLLGAGESVVAPASMRWVRSHFPETGRGTAVSIYLAGISVGLAAGAPLSARLASQLGWRPMFLLLGLGSLLWLLPWTILVPRDAGGLGGAAEQISIAPLLHRPAIVGVILGTFCYNYFLYFCMTWMPAYLVERGRLSLDRMGFILLCAFGGLTLTATLAGASADRLIHRGYAPVPVRKAFAMAGLLLASTEVWSASASSVSSALFFVVFSLAGLGLASSNAWALTHTLVPGEAIGRIIGIQNFVANLAGILAPLVTGWLKQRTSRYDAPLQVVWAVLILGFFAYGLLVRSTEKANVHRAFSN